MAVSKKKGNSKSRSSKQTKPTEAKRFKKKVKTKPTKKNRTIKPNQSAKSGSAMGEITNSARDFGFSKKRKRDSASVNEIGKKTMFIKQSKSAGGLPSSKDLRTNYLKSSGKDVGISIKKEANTPRERRLAAKEMVEARKMKRKPNYTLEKELASLWEKMRCYSIGKEERSKLVSDALQKMSGKLLEVASSHVSARVLQTCVKYGSKEERNFVFDELRPHLLTLSRKKYAVHLVKKLLDAASKQQLEGFISSLHGHVSFLIRHAVGSAVVEHAYHLANGSQRQRLLMELYSPELQLFKDLTFANTGSLVDTISKLKLQKSSVLHHMTSIIQPLLEKGIVDYSIIHATLVEYFTIADRSSAEYVIQQLLPLLSQGSVTDDSPQPSTKRKNKRKTRIPLVKMMNTRDGLKVGILCIKHGTARDRKKIVKGIKDHIRKLALDQYGSLLLSSILSVVDDTKLVTKIIIRELQSMLRELVLDKNGRRLLLLLLRPQCHRYLTPEDLFCLNLTVPSLRVQDEREEESDLETGQEKILENDTEVVIAQSDKHDDSMKTIKSAVGGKKDALVRRKELLVESGLAESLIETCIGIADELLRSNVGREVIFEVAVGGSDDILESLSHKLVDLHEAIATVAITPPKPEESDKDHLFDNFHSSRTIRKLILDSPSFAETLWRMALEGRSEKWAKGHSSKVVSAFLESSEPSVRDLTKSELQPLVDSGILKLPERK